MESVDAARRTKGNPNSPGRRSQEPCDFRSAWHPGGGGEKPGPPRDLDCDIFGNSDTETHRERERYGKGLYITFLKHSYFLTSLVVLQVSLVFDDQENVLLVCSKCYSCAAFIACKRGEGLVLMSLRIRNITVFRSGAVYPVQLLYGW